MAQPSPAPLEPLTVEVDMAALAVVLHALSNTPPSMWHPSVCRAALELEAQLDGDVGGFLDIGWGLRASDLS